MARFNSEYKAILDKFFEDIPGVKPGKLFSYPVYFVGVKLLARIYEGSLGLKVPESMAEKIGASNL